MSFTSLSQLDESNIYSVGVILLVRLIQQAKTAPANKLANQFYEEWYRYDGTQARFDSLESMVLLANMWVSSKLALRMMNFMTAYAKHSMDICRELAKTESGITTLVSLTSLVVSKNNFLSPAVRFGGPAVIEAIPKHIITTGALSVAAAHWPDYLDDMLGRADRSQLDNPAFYHTMARLAFDCPARSARLSPCSTSDPMLILRLIKKYNLASENIWICAERSENLTVQHTEFILYQLGMFAIPDAVIARARENNNTRFLEILEIFGLA